VSREPGPLLASGRSADVFERGDGLVLRRYRSPRDTEGEAAIMRYAEAHGFPVPRVHEASATDIVMERIEGPTMLDDLARRPWRVAAHAALLASLHHRLHAIAAPAWLPSPLGAGDVLVHLDLHPQNVLLAARGPVVIDWPNAIRGAGEDDVAQTWVILATAAVPGSRAYRLVGRLFRGFFLRAFLGHFDRAAVARQLPVVAARWLRDRNVEPAEREATARLLRREGGVPPLRQAGPPPHRSSP